MRCSCLSVCNGSNATKRLFINLILESFTEFCQHIPVLIENRTETKKKLHEDLRAFLRVSLLTFVGADNISNKLIIEN